MILKSCTRLLRVLDPSSISICLFIVVYVYKMANRFTYVINKAEKYLGTLYKVVTEVVSILSRIFFAEMVPSDNKVSENVMSDVAIQKMVLCSLKLLA